MQFPNATTQHLIMLKPTLRQKEIFCKSLPRTVYYHLVRSNAAIDVVKKLVRPISTKGRNLTTDNRYTSVPLVEDMARNDISPGVLKRK